MFFLGGLVLLVIVAGLIGALIPTSESELIEALNEEIRDDADRIYSIAKVADVLSIDIYLEWPGDNPEDDFADELSDVVQDVSKSALDYERLRMTVATDLTTPEGGSVETVVADVQWTRAVVESIEWSDYDQIELVESLSSRAEFHNPGYHIGYTETPTPTTTTATTEAPTTTTTTTTTTEAPTTTSLRPEVALRDELGDDFTQIERIQWDAETGQLEVTGTIGGFYWVAPNAVAGELADAIQDASKFAGEVSLFTVNAQAEIISSDLLGNETTTTNTLLSISWSGETVYGIQWGTFDQNNVWALGDISLFDDFLAEEWLIDADVLRRARLE